MKDKKILISLVVALLLIATLSILYSLNLNNEPQPEPTPQTLKPVTTTKKPNSDIEAIKKRINNIKNDSLAINEDLNEDCNTEESKDYQEKVLEGAASISEGVVISMENSQIQVTFSQGAILWVSNIKTDADTSISITDQGVPKPASLTDIKIGDKVLVKAGEGRIVDDVFKAARVDVLR